MGTRTIHLPKSSYALLSAKAQQRSLAPDALADKLVSADLAALRYEVASALGAEAPSAFRNGRLDRCIMGRGIRSSLYGRRLNGTGRFEWAEQLHFESATKRMLGRSASCARSSPMRASRSSRSQEFCTSDGERSGFDTSSKRHCGEVRGRSRSTAATGADTGALWDRRSHGCARRGRTWEEICESACRTGGHDLS
jgi:hypothetical protein